MTARDITTPDGAFGFSLPDTLTDPFERAAHALVATGYLNDSFLEIGMQFGDAVAQLAIRGVVAWSAKLGLTPAQWLEIYTPEVTLKPREAGENEMMLGLVVTAKVRGS